MRVVCPVRAVGLRTMMYVLYAGKKLVTTSKLKSMKHAGIILAQTTTVHGFRFAHFTRS